MSKLYNKALDFATRAHGTQVRKYTFEPYINHPVEVAKILRGIVAPEFVLAAALLHDVLEDTPVTPDEMRKEFGDQITDLVLEVTNVALPGSGNRITRMARNRDHLAKASFWGQTIKFADFIANGKDLGKNDPDFFKVYRREKNNCLVVMWNGHQDLWYEARLVYENE